MVMKYNIDIECFDSCVELFVTTERGPLLILLLRALIKKLLHHTLLLDHCDMVFCLPVLRYRQDVPACAYLSLHGVGSSAHPCVIFRKTAS